MRLCISFDKVLVFKFVTFVLLVFCGVVWLFVLVCVGLLAVLLIWVAYIWYFGVFVEIDLFYYLLSFGMWLVWFGLLGHALWFAFVDLPLL